jgi:hypothetical protein
MVTLLIFLSVIIFGFFAEILKAYSSYEALPDIKGNFPLQHSLDCYRIFEFMFKIKKNSLIFIFVQ